MCDVLITADVSPNFVFISITKTNFFSFLWQNIESYLIEKNADKAILEEREKNIGGLTESTRRFLIGHLADYAVSVFGLNVTRIQLIPFCKAVVAVFPSLNLANDKTVNIVCLLIRLSII